MGHVWGYYRLGYGPAYWCCDRCRKRHPDCRDRSYMFHRFWPVIFIVAALLGVSLVSCAHQTGCTNSALVCIS